MKNYFLSPRQLEEFFTLDFIPPRFPSSFIRAWEAEERRDEKLRVLAKRACFGMPQIDKERLRIEPYSTLTMEPEDAKRRAKSDISRRLQRAPLSDPNLANGVKQTLLWDFFFELSSLDLTIKEKRAWVLLLVYNTNPRARGKESLTDKRVKGLLDYMTSKKFLCYNKQTRVYTLHPRLAQVVRVLRHMEKTSLEDQVYPKSERKRVIRDRG